MENKFKKATFIIRNMDSTLRKNLQIGNKMIHEDKLWENTFIKHQIDERNAGNTFPLEYHVRGMIYAMIVPKISWKSIEKDFDTKTGMISSIDDVFYNYDIDRLLKCDIDDLFNRLKELGCKGKNVHKLLEAIINCNIPNLLDFENNYGGVDEHYKIFAEKDSTLKSLVRAMSGTKSSDKMQKIGASLAKEYLRNVGYDIAKPDISIRRILGCKRLGFSEKETVSANEAVDIITLIAKRTKRSIAEINHILWLYCDKHLGFCSQKTDCKNCGVKKYCNYPKIEFEKKQQEAELKVSLVEIDSVTSQNQNNKEKRDITTNEMVGVVKSIIPEKPPTIEEYDKLVLKEKIVKERSAATEKRSRSISNITKEELRRRDQRKFSSPHSLTDIRTKDSFVSQLIEKYDILQNKYASDFPLGLIDVSKDEFLILGSRVKRYIEESSSVTLLSGFISSLFLVKSVENYGIKGNFWRAISSLLGLPEGEITDFLKKALLAFCSSEKLYFHYYDSIRSYTGTVLIHSVIGFDELETSLDFMRDYYIEEMRESYSKETVNEYISRFIEILSADVQEDESEEHCISGIYKVSFNLKNACLVFSEAMADIMNCLLFNIHAYYHRISDTSYSPAVFYKYYKRWCINDLRHIRAGSSVVRKINNSSRTKNTVKQVEKLSENKKCSYFIDENYELYLYLPQFEIPSDYAESCIVTHFYSGSERLNDYDIENETFGIFRFHTSEQTIKLSRFYKELSIKIETENGEIIFDSRAQLVRNYIVFDSALTETSTRRIPDERFYILTEKGTEFFADDNYNSYPSSNYIVHSLNVDKNCDITVDSQMVFRNYDDSIDVSITVDSKYRVRNAKVLFNGEKYRVYTDAPEVIIDYSDSNAAEYIIDINEKHIGLDELCNNNVDLNEYTDNRFISIALRRKGSLRHIVEYSIAVIKGFEFSLDKKYYYSEKVGQLLDIYADDINFDIPDYPYTFSITHSRELSVNAYDHGYQLTFEIKLPVIYWEINDTYNSLLDTKYVSASSIRDIRSFTLDVPVNNVSIMAVNDNMHRQLSYSNHKVDISDFHNSVSDSTTFGISNKDIGQYTLFELIYTSTLRDVSVVCNVNSLIISYFSIGKCPVDIVIKDKADREVFSNSYPFCDDGVNTITENISSLNDGIYKVQISLIQEDAFGFSSTKKPIGIYTFVKGSPFALFLKSNRNILKPEYSYFDGSEKKRVQNFYIDGLVKPDDESEVYIGNAYYHNKKGDKVYFKDANPIRVELLEKKDVILSFTITDRDNDGLLYEKARGYLVNDNAGLRDYNSYSLPDHYAIKLRGE